MRILRFLIFLFITIFITACNDGLERLSVCTSSKQNNFFDLFEGTFLNPHVICSLEDFDNIRNDLSAHYVLGQDIDATVSRIWDRNGKIMEIEDSPFGFKPFKGEFSGSLDGKGHSIKGLYVNFDNFSQKSLFGSGCRTTGFWNCRKGNNYIRNIVFSELKLSGNNFSFLISKNINLKLSNIFLDASLDNSTSVSIIAKELSGNHKNISVDLKLKMVRNYLGLAKNMNNAKLTNLNINISSLNHMGEFSYLAEESIGSVEINTSQIFIDINFHKKVNGSFSGLEKVFSKLDVKNSFFNFKVNGNSNVNVAGITMESNGSIHFENNFIKNKVYDFHEFYGIAKSSVSLRVLNSKLDFRFVNDYFEGAEKFVGLVGSVGSKAVVKNSSLLVNLGENLNSVSGLFEKALSIDVLNSYVSLSLERVSGEAAGMFLSSSDGTVKNSFVSLKVSSSVASRKKFGYIAIDSKTNVKLNNTYVSSNSILSKDSMTSFNILKNEKSIADSILISDMQSDLGNSKLFRTWDFENVWFANKGNYPELRCNLSFTDCSLWNFMDSKSDKTALNELNMDINEG